MHGSYIRRRWNIDCNHIDPAKTLDQQIPLLEECFSEAAPYDCRTYPFTLSFEKKNQKASQAAGEDFDIHRAYRDLLDKKEKNPDLFVEPGIIRLFKYVPQLVEIFKDAGTLRRALAERILQGGDEKYTEMYAVCCAIYDTLLIRHRFMISASLLTSSELIEKSPSYSSASYAYCLKQQYAHLHISDK